MKIIGQAWESIKNWDSIMYLFPTMYVILAFTLLSKAIIDLGISSWQSLLIVSIISLPIGGAITLGVVVLKIKLEEADRVDKSSK